MTAASCPRCGRELVDAGCLFCGPLSELQRTPAAAASEAAPGWAGYDRELGAKKKAERAAEALDASRRRERVSRLPALLGTVLSLAFVGVVAWLWTTGRLERTAPLGPPLAGPLPARLSAPPSSSRPELGLLARALDEVAAEAEDRLAGQVESDLGTLDRLQNRLDSLKRTAHALEPSLSREEQRVLLGLQHARRETATFVSSFRGQAPDVAGGRVRAAREQITRALALLRGADVPDLVQAYVEKASAAAKLQEELERP